MEARYAAIGLACLALCNVAATARTKNFVVQAEDPQFAQQVASAAEHYRKELAHLWLGTTLPNWKHPCQVKVKINPRGAGGHTTFTFDRGEVFGWNMFVQGPQERILDSVLPHEVNHTIFACHFRRPLPRWADEGASTLVEDESERRRQMLTALDVLKSGRRIPFRGLMNIMEYPKNTDDVMTLYAEGYVLCDMLVQKGGRKKYLDFINAANRDGWDRAVHVFYGYRGVDALEQEWSKWLMAGCPPQVIEPGVQLAENKPVSPDNPNLVARSQTPDYGPIDIQDAVPRTEEEVSLPVEVTSPIAPKRGRGLEAPAPREPAMLSAVNLGAPVQFAENSTEDYEAGEHSPPKPLRTVPARAPAGSTLAKANRGERLPNEMPAAFRAQAAPRMSTPRIGFDTRPHLGKAVAFHTAG